MPTGQGRLSMGQAGSALGLSNPDFTARLNDLRQPMPYRPEDAASELLQFHPMLPAWCRVETATKGPLLHNLRLAAGAGEAEAIALAHDRKADVILLDHKKGRQQAETLGLSCLALPAVIVAAKRNGLIPSVADELSWEMLGRAHGFGDGKAPTVAGRAGLGTCFHLAQGHERA